MDDSKLRSRVFTAPNGVQRKFSFRDGTNDESCIIACFEEDFYGICDRQFKEGEVVIDMGAHIGSVTMLMLSVEPKLKVISIEALPENANLVRLNTAQNGVETVLYENLVFGKTDDVEKSIYYGDQSNESGRVHKFIGTIIDNASEEIQDARKHAVVKTITVADIFKNENIDRCRYVKMDIEGAEKDIFTTIDKETLEKIDEVCGEWHYGDYKELFNVTQGVFVDATTDPHNFDFINKDRVNEIKEDK